MVSLFRHPVLFGPIFPVVAIILLTRPFGITFFFAGYGVLVLLKRLDGRAWKGYEPDSTDVIVATYSKSGTYWALQIALQIAHKGPQYGVIESLDHIHDVVPWREIPVRGVAPLRREQPTTDGTRKSKEEQVAFVESHKRESSYGATKNQPIVSPPTGLRIIKTAINPTLIPYNENAKYISIIRDSKEVLASGYKFWPPMFGIEHQTMTQMWLEFKQRLKCGWNSASMEEAKRALRLLSPSIKPNAGNGENFPTGWFYALPI